MSDDIFKEIPDLQYREELPQIDSKEFLKVIYSRRSIRVYQDEKVPEHIMNQILDAALLAPNSSNLQCWEFHWPKGDNVKKEIVRACLSQPAAKTAPELIVCVARTKTWEKHRHQMLQAFEQEEKVPNAAKVYYQKIVPLAYNQGPLGLLGPLKWLMVNIRGLFKPTPREPTSKSEMKIWASKSVALACENIMLTARALGYDSCPMEGYDSSRIKKSLNLSQDAFPVMVISIGKRAPSGVYGKQIRFPRDQFIKIHQ